MAASKDDSDMGHGDSDLNSRACFCFCFCFPCFNVGGGLWERVRAAESEERWWSRGFSAIRKTREWSEIVAGPKWKTFIRRFNRNRGGARQGKFQYDPLSYALNFDEGQNGNSEEDADFGRFPDFSADLGSQKGKDVSLL